MKINPNYLRILNYSKISNQSLQTNPNFGNKNKLIQGAAKTAATAAAGTVLAMQNGKDNENKIPTREEFQNILKNVTINEEEVDKWLELYDHNPQNAIIAFFTGNVDTETDTEMHPFLLRVANSIITLYPFISKEHVNGIRSMLRLKDEIGNLRFDNRLDYVFAADVFGKYPEIATQYANAKDNRGSYRFSADEIIYIVQKTSGEYPPEKIDEFMNLQRPDGSYVNKEFYWRNFEIYMKNPKEYIELCNILIGGDTYIFQEHIANIITHYINYPDEIKEILQKMPQFSTEELTSSGTRAGLNLHIAPKSFKRLAGIKISDTHAFSLEEICDIIGKFELDKKEANNPKEFKATLRMLSVLGILEEDSYTRYLNLEQIFKASEIYKKYPLETVDIIKNYYRTPECDVLIPTEDDIKLYKENRSEFNKKYQLK